MSMLDDKCNRCHGGGKATRWDLRDIEDVNSLYLVGVENCPRCEGTGKSKEALILQRFEEARERAR